MVRRTSRGRSESATGLPFSDGVKRPKERKRAIQDREEDKGKRDQDRDGEEDKAEGKDKEQDEAEIVINNFIKYASVPVVNMESSVGHPLQALADAITLEENQPTGEAGKVSHKPKVVLSWAPHPKALPHAVANSFIDMMLLQDAEFVITHPKGYELNADIVKNASVEYNQEKAFENADFIYVKNWSSYKEYGQVIPQDKDWMITGGKMNLTNNAKFMHLNYKRIIKRRISPKFSTRYTLYITAKFYQRRFKTCCG